MAEEAKPIKTERIDNPDGTYTVKEVYAKPNFGYYLSNIETFDSSDKMLSGTYYNDRKFEKLLCIETREYIENGYYRIVKYEKPRKNNAVSIKCLCNNDGKDIKTWYYEDKECNEPLIYSETEHFEDGTTKSKNTWYKDKFYNEVYQDSKERTIKEVTYSDSEFKNIYSTTEYQYNDDGSYTAKVIMNEYSDDSCHSIITSYNKNGNLIKSKTFFDKNFNKQHSVSTAKYLKDGSYITKTSYEKYNEDGWKSTIEKYDKNYNFLYGKYYLNKNFSNLAKKTSTVYKTDGSYTDYVAYKKQKKYKSYLSYIEEYDNSKRYISSKYYKDKNFKNLYWSCNRQYITENHYIDSIVTTDFTDNNEQYKSYTEEINTDENWEKSKFYKNEDFTDLFLSICKYINQNGNNEKQLVYENDQNGWHSTIYEIEKETNRRIKQVWYADKEFSNIYTEGYATYNEDGSYTVKLVYYKPTKEFSSRIEYYNTNNKLIKIYLFKDKEFSQLYATDTYEYLKNKTVIRKTIFEEMHENRLSGLEYSNKKEEVIYCTAYVDKDFKNIYRKTWIKYTKNHKFFLRIYTQKQDGVYSEIEKYDRNKNMIYKKQHKFKGIFAHILFWLAR